MDTMRPAQIRAMNSQKDIPGMAIVAVKLVVLLSSVALANYACQLALHPLYGSIPTSFHFASATLVSCMLSSTLPIRPYPAFLTLATVLCAAPFTAFKLGSYTARFHNPTWGPVATQIGLAIPITVAAAGLSRHWIGPLLPASRSGVPRNALGFAVWGVVAGTEQFWAQRLTPGGIVTSCNLFLGLGAASVAAALVSRATESAPAPIRPSSIKPKSKPQAQPNFIVSTLPLALPLLLSLLSTSQRPCHQPSLPYLALNNTLRVLDRAESITGTVMVAENLQSNYRFLRCDHSLLGGVWLRDDGTGTGEKTLSDSIYAAFALQEAARLIERPQRDDSEKERALVIGLGAGIAATAFIKHQINTTVVEIDPVVYKYARQYLGLLEPQEVYLEDARGWVRNQALSLQGGAHFREGMALQNQNRQYDYVIHDCFSGGSVPEHIFTREFWGDLKEIVKVDGVVAVNFAGIVGAEPARSILATLLNTFTQCRIFHDQFDTNSKTADFLNMVFFCTSTSDPIAFRDSTPADYLGSRLREVVLSSVSTREVAHGKIWGNANSTAEKPEDMTPWILTDETNPLGEWQKASGLEHWKVMREVMPDAIWETY